MTAVDALTASATFILCPLLFAIAVIDLFPNPVRFLMRKMVSTAQVEFKPTSMRTRRVLIAADETSHEAVEWALGSFLDGSTDIVFLVYVPEGDFGRSAYKHPMHLDRYSYTDVLEGVDFLWEYCQRLDILNVQK